MKPGGLVYTDVPFLVGFHASPYDYTRWTIEGVKDLFKNFEIIDLKICGGPTSAFLWIFQEWISLLFSFGNKTIYRLIFFTVISLTFPIKFLDYFLNRHPLAKNASATFVLIGKK